MERIVKTTVTCRICGIITETNKTVDLACVPCPICSTEGEYMIRKYTEQEYKIQTAEKKMQSLNKALQHINRERDLWEKRLSFYLSDGYENMQVLEEAAEEESDRELANLLENIDGM